MFLKRGVRLLYQPVFAWLIFWVFICLFILACHSCMSAGLGEFASFIILGEFVCASFFVLFSLPNKAVTIDLLSLLEHEGGKCICLGTYCNARSHKCLWEFYEGKHIGFLKVFFFLEMEKRRKENFDGHLVILKDLGSNFGFILMMYWSCAHLIYRLDKEIGPMELISSLSKKPDPFSLSMTIVRMRRSCFPRD